MKTQNRHNLFIFLFFVALFIVVLQYKFCTSEEQKMTAKELAYKRQLIEQDSLRKVDSVTYARLVNDMYKERELSKVLETENKQLYDKLKEQEQKVMSLTKVVGKLKSQKSVVPIVNNEGQRYFEDYYPKKENYFVRYKAQIGENKVNGEFTFHPLHLDLVITEKQKGVYEAYLNAPSWLEISSLEVKSLPLTSPSLRPDNFDWLFGGLVGYSYLDKRPLLGVNGGFRYKKTLYFLQGSTNQTLYLGVSKLF
jgi:hypothetical protein|nr:MAG TPA: hypothetical protein [Caudoviricetes sp.]